MLLISLLRQAILFSLGWSSPDNMTNSGREMRDQCLHLPWVIFYHNNTELTCVMVRNQIIMKACIFVGFLWWMRISHPHLIRIGIYEREGMVDVKEVSDFGE